VTDLRDHDLQLIEPWERQCDRDAAIERAKEELAALPLDELLFALPDDAWKRTREAIADRVEAHTNVLTESAQAWLRKYVMDTFGTDLAEDRIDSR